MHWRHCDDIFHPVFAPVPKNRRTVYSSGINLVPSMMPERPILTEEFELAAPPAGHAAKIEEEIAAAPDSVSIHVRRTDYLIQSEPWSVPFVYYERAIKTIKSRVANPKWFVFSDDPEWCRDAFSGILGSFTVVEGNARKPATDIHLMKSCRHHIIANSTFSWWGAYLSHDISGITLCPSFWGPYVKGIPGGFYPDWWETVDCG